MSRPITACGLVTVAADCSYREGDVVATLHL
eukprot:COSAG01_NODE_39143_length_480_cov_1.343832_1_plen_30_part_01